MKASLFHDPGPKPTRYVVFGPGSWKTGRPGPEASTARHSRNIRTHNGGSREAQRRVILRRALLGVAGPSTPRPGRAGDGESRVTGGPRPGGGRRPWS